MKWKKGCDMTMVDQNENSIFLSFSSNNLIKEPEFASNATRDTKHSNAQHFMSQLNTSCRDNGFSGFPITNSTRQHFFDRGQVRIICW